MRLWASQVVLQGLFKSSDAVDHQVRPGLFLCSQQMSLLGSRMSEAGRSARHSRYTQLDP